MYKLAIVLLVASVIAATEPQPFFQNLIRLDGRYIQQLEFVPLDECNQFALEHCNTKNCAWSDEHAICYTTADQDLITQLEQDYVPKSFLSHKFEQLEAIQMAKDEISKQTKAIKNKKVVQ